MVVVQDMTLTCRGCNSAFVFSAGEQEFFQQKGFQHTPSRCKRCRVLRRQKNPRTTVSVGAFRQQSQYPTVCAQCGASTQVPFRPVAGKAVFCRTCYYVRSHPGESMRAFAPD